jgi:hypothetical protein
MHTIFVGGFATGRFAMGSNEPLGTASPAGEYGTDSQDSDTIIIDGLYKPFPAPPAGGKRKRGALAEDELMAFTTMTEPVKDVAQEIRENKPTDVHPELYHLCSNQSLRRLPTSIPISLFSFPTLVMSSKLAGLWKVSYATRSDPDLGCHSFLDGDLQLWAKNWMVLRDHLGKVVIGRYLKPEEKIQEGGMIFFPTHFAHVMRSLLPANEVRESAHAINSGNWIWKVTYSTIKDLDRGRFKAYDGSLVLIISEKWLILKNAKGDPIAVQAVSADRVSRIYEVFAVGSKVNFPLHTVRMGICMVSGSVPQVSVQPSSLVVESSSRARVQSIFVVGCSTSEVIEPTNISATDRDASDSSVNSAVFTAMNMGLDFSDGISFAKFIRHKFYSAVHPSKESGSFTMVVSFGRANFRLSEDSVGIALEAAIGGYCGSLMVSQLGDRVFSFLVSSKQVGFHVLNLRSYSCPKFKCFFHLWGCGGPNWTHEFKLWQKECNEEWTLVSPSKRRMQLGLNALKSVMPKPTIKSDSSAKKKLSFASVIDYNACKGYTGENASKSQHTLGQSVMY